MLYCIIYYSLLFIVFVGLMIGVANSDRARYTLKFVFIYSFFCIYSGYISPWLLFRKRDHKNLELLSPGLRKLLNLLNIKLVVRGKENLVKNSGCVVLLNHQSAIDVCVIGVLFPLLKNCAVIVKNELKYYGTFGFYLHSSNSIFVKRQKSSEAHAAVNQTTNAIQNEQKKIIIFPEGHRHLGATFQPFKKGAFHIAIDSQAPIQPIVVSKYYFINSAKHIFNSGTSYIDILPAIPTKGLTKDDLPKLLETVEGLMHKTYKESSQEAVHEHLKQLKTELLE